MRRESVREVATVAAAALVAIGVLGFVPGVTSDATAFAFAGNGSRAMLFGLFRVSIVLNLLHVLAGAVGFALARTEHDARRFLTGGGTAFLGLWLLGVVKAGGWIPVNGADAWLDLVLGVGLIGAGRAAERPVAAL